MTIDVVTAAARTIINIDIALQEPKNHLRPLERLLEGSTSKPSRFMAGARLNSVYDGEIELTGLPPAEGLYDGEVELIGLPPAEGLCNGEVELIGLPPADGLYSISNLSRSIARSRSILAYEPEVVLLRLWPSKAGV